MHAAATFGFCRVLSALSIVLALAASAFAKPNVIVIVADDLGSGEIVCHGKQEIPTPNIRSIASNGVCFANAYVSCPVCSPTRAGLMTSRYQQRFGHEFNPGPATQAEKEFGLPLDQVTLADRMKKLGYATGMVGKWHLGYKPEFHPQKRGFDEFFGFLGGAHSYNDARVDAANPILRGTEPVDEKEYLTDAFAREAVAFIDRHKTEPFFLYLPFNATHAPLQAPDKYLNRFSQVSDQKRRTFSAMLSAMDDAIGSVLEKLRQDKLEENTLVFFIGDNGGPTLQISSGNGALRGYKGGVFEGGIRVPCMAQWKGHLPAGREFASPVIALDIGPTVVAAAAGTITGGQPLDGVNLIPYVEGEKTGSPHESLFWRFGQQWAIRQGDYKLAAGPESPTQLFDLSKDVGEQHDLSKEHPEVVAKLKKDYDAWNSELVEPKWQGRQRAANAERRAKNKAKNRGKQKAKATEL